MLTVTMKWVSVETEGSAKAVASLEEGESVVEEAGDTGGRSKGIQ